MQESKFASLDNAQAPGRTGLPSPPESHIAGLPFDNSFDYRSRDWSLDDDDAATELRSTRDAKRDLLTEMKLSRQLMRERRALMAGC
jgi:hypothetical protein